MISSGERMPLTFETVAVFDDAQSMPVIELSVMCKLGALIAAIERKVDAEKPPLLGSHLWLLAGSADGTRTERVTCGALPFGCSGEISGNSPLVGSCSDSTPTTIASDVEVFLTALARARLRV